jgi:hypothetical protein
MLRKGKNVLKKRKMEFRKRKEELRKRKDRGGNERRSEGSKGCVEETKEGGKKMT